jgi:hypothetical protein
MKNYNLWHTVQICIFYGTEHISYIFLWRTRNFLFLYSGIIVSVKLLAAIFPLLMMVSATSTSIAQQKPLYLGPIEREHDEWHH